MFNWICSPAATELEETVMDWLASALALPHAMHQTAGGGKGGGIMMGSSSETILTAMIAARDRAIDDLVGLHADVDERQAASSLLIAIGGSSTHSSAEKAARILGLRYVEVATDASSDFCITEAAFKRTVDRCRESGFQPFFVAATLGMCCSIVEDPPPSVV